jgi:hypothetical protein
MALVFFKWLLVPVLLFSPVSGRHPIFVSVIEIEHNAKEKSLEVTCRIFTDDFEKTLREEFKKPVDLLKENAAQAMNPLVSQYIMQHLKIAVNGKTVSMQFKGFEPVEEAIYSYFEVDGVNAVQTIDIDDDILYSYKKEQMGIIHVTVNGERKSTRLLNPQRKAQVTF